jgi:transcription-repair coupling factor (superfamily II helicase)
MTDTTRPTFPAPPLPRAGQAHAWWRAPRSPSALAFAIARAADAHDGPLLAIAKDNQGAHQLEADLRTLLGNDASMPILPFPDWETLPYDQFSPHADIVSQRLAALLRLPTLKRGVVVVPVQTMLQRLAPVRYVVGNAFDVKVGQRLDLDAEKRRLESAGYRHVPQVFDPGDFAVRGGLLDVYPMGADEPYRVELFDDEIDSIRGFDPETQRSLDKVDAVQLLPGREVPLDEDALKRAMQTLRDRFDIDTRRSALFQDLKAGLAPAGIEYYLPIFFDHTATLFDYLGERVLPIVCDGALACADVFWSQNARCCRRTSCTCRPTACANCSTCVRASTSSAAMKRRPRRRRPWAINRRRTCRWPRATPPRAR